jgi:hypothetical protein
MATQIVILNGDSIKIDNDYHLEWADKGKNFQDGWCPSTFHAVIWNSLPGPNEIQNKDANGMMTGSTTVADLLVWAETRKLQIEEAETAYKVAVDDDIANNTNNTLGKTWRDYDSNYS